MTTGMQVMTLRVTNNGTMIGNVDNDMILVSDSTTAKIPAGAIIRDIYFKKVSTLTTSVTLALGISGTADWFVPAAAGLSTTDLNIKGSLGYEPVGIRTPTDAEYTLVVNPSANCGGSIEIYIEYMVYDYLV